MRRGARGCRGSAPSPGTRRIPGRFLHPTKKRNAPGTTRPVRTSPRPAALRARRRARHPGAATTTGPAPGRPKLLAEHLVEVLGDRIAQRVVEEVFVLAAAVEEAERQLPRFDRLDLDLRAQRDQPRLLVVHRVQPQPLLVRVQVHERVDPGGSDERIVDDGGGHDDASGEDEDERKSRNHTFHMAGFYSPGGSIVILSSSSVGPSAARARPIASGSASIPARRSPPAPNARASAGTSGLLRSASPQRPSYIRCWRYLIAP